ASIVSMMAWLNGKPARLRRISSSRLISTANSVPPQPAGPVKVILTNVQQAVGVYTLDVTDPNLFDSNFYPLTFPNATLSLSFQTAGSANSYILNASMPIFSSYMAQTPSTPGYAIRANNGVFVVTQYNSATQVIASPIRQPVYDLEASPDAPPLINLSPAVSALLVGTAATAAEGTAAATAATAGLFGAG
ncbi:unnamed protein product, partial [Sphagnum compactum]